MQNKVGDPMNPSRRLLHLWLLTWTSRGFEPHFLILNDAKNHDNFTFYDEIFSKIPTFNHRWYEQACYRRWLAASTHDHGTFMDFDIYPLDDNPLFRYKQLMEMETKEYKMEMKNGNENSLLWTYQDILPMMTHFTKGGIDRFLNIIENYKLDPKRDVYKGVSHTSDMLIASNERNKVFTKILSEHDHRVFHFSHALYKAQKPILNLKLDIADWTNLLLKYSFINRFNIWIVNGDISDPSFNPYGHSGSFPIPSLVSSIPSFTLGNRQLILSDSSPLSLPEKIDMNLVPKEEAVKLLINPHDLNSHVYRVERIDQIKRGINNRKDKIIILFDTKFPFNNLVDHDPSVIIVPKDNMNIEYLEYCLGFYFHPRYHWNKLKIEKLQKKSIKDYDQYVNRFNAKVDLIMKIDQQLKQFY